MKIRNRISLFYTSISAILFGVAFTTIWMVENHYIDNLFDSYLAEKALLCAQKNWERDELSEKSYSEILSDYQNLLPTAEEVLIDSTSHDCLAILQQLMTPRQIDKLLKDKVTHFNQGKKRGLALSYHDNEGSFFVVVIAENRYGNSIKDYSIILLVVLYVLAGVVILFAGRLHSKHTLLPLQHLLKEVSSIDADNLTQRVEVKNNDDELDRLAEQTNHMLDRLQKAFENKRTFVRNASHQLNNPLTIIRGECELALMRSRTPEEYQQTLTKILATEELMGNAIRQMLLLADSNGRVQPSAIEVVDLWFFLQEMCEDNPRIVVQMSENCDNWLVSTEPNMLRTVLDNLLNNACKYSTDEVSVVLTQERGATSVVITDKGIGIPKTELEMIFQPFYRASNTQGVPGQGIGLSLTQRICQLLNVKLQVASSEGVGTRIELAFPTTQQESIS